MSLPRKLSVLLASTVLCAVPVALIAPSPSSASSLKKPAPCYLLQTDLAFVAGIQTRAHGKPQPVIAVRGAVACRIARAAGGRVSAYTIRLIGRHGKYAGKVLSVAVGQAWIVGDGKMQYTDARVTKGYPKRDWTL